MEPKDESEGDDQVMLDASGVFCKKLSTKIREIFDECPAGPASYLARHVNSVEAKQAFVSWLWGNFPERSDILYVHDVDAAPRVTENDLAQSPPAAFHVASLAFSDLSSIKPPPGKELAVQLIDFFLKEGFVTSGEPLLISMPESLVEENRGVTSPWDSEGKVTLAPFSVGYVKGRARATSLLALLHVMYSDATFSKEDLENHCPKLIDTVTSIWAHHLRQNTKEDEVLTNLRLSLRGSLRKAANVVQMAAMVRKLLMEGGTDYMSFVRRWNVQTVAAHQIKGRKGIALKLLFESAPKDLGSNTKPKESSVHHHFFPCGLGGLGLRFWYALIAKHVAIQLLDQCPSKADSCKSRITYYNVRDRALEPSRLNVMLFQRGLETSWQLGFDFCLLCRTSLMPFCSTWG